MIRKVFEIASLLCPQCGGEMKVISFIEDHKVIDKIIDHLKFTFMVERPPPSQVVQQELMMAAEERGDISKGLLSGLLSICGVKSILLLNTH
jgi:hypothetical protein